MRELIVIVVGCLASGLVTAQTAVAPSELEETFELMRQFMAVERETMIDAELQLTAAERERFWPLYQTYRAEMASVQDRYGVLLADFAENHARMDEATADSLIDEYFSIEQAMLQIRQAHVPRFREVLPAQKVARFVQMENKIDGVALLPLLLDVPLIGDTQ